MHSSHDKVWKRGKLSLHSTHSTITPPTNSTITPSTNSTITPSTNSIHHHSIHQLHPPTPPSLHCHKVLNTCWTSLGFCTNLPHPEWYSWIQKSLALWLVYFSKV
ncbi:hypothetical protein Pmani_028012 [Petrolisthes manimaculis]|uniref:Uncharacterized protein n=1 Tax=Petrolisthes manimaculis TaxID=1843537 RepID=A0AAE1P2Z1_9EUCA|nr:hypothetical protein Pmani_028012 [Petrolisthes manimaculis]